MEWQLFRDSLHINYKSATCISQLTSTTICAQSYKDPPAIVVLCTQPVFIFYIMLFHRVASVILTPSRWTKKWSQEAGALPVPTSTYRLARILTNIGNNTTCHECTEIQNFFSFVCGEQQMHYKIILKPKYYTIWHPRCPTVLSCHGFNVFFFLGGGGVYETCRLYLSSSWSWPVSEIHELFPSQEFPIQTVFKLCATLISWRV